MGLINHVIKSVKNASDAGRFMKCPLCNKKLSIKKTQVSSFRAEYFCIGCDKKFVHKYGQLFFVTFLLIGAPILEVILRLTIEPVSYMLFGDLELVGVEFSRILSTFFTFLIMAFIFWKIFMLLEEI